MADPAPWQHAFRWRGKDSAGSISRPEIIWSGSKTGYLWIGDDDGRCAITMSNTQARRLRDFLDEHLSGATNRDRSVPPETDG